MPKFNEHIRSLDKPENNSFVYGLLDPNTNELKYIGQTFQGFNRIKEHYYHSNKRSRKTGGLSKSQLWISGLKKENKIFKVVYFEYCDKSILDDIEIFYIEYFKYLGSSLLNHHLGGQPNKNGWSNEARELISKRTKEALNTPEHKEFFRKNAYKNIAGYNKGKKMSQESKDKISASQQHKTWKFLTEDGQILSGMRKAAAYFGCSQSAINHLVSGRVKTIYGKTIKFWRD